MRICNDCKCLVNDNEKNCPVCGAHTHSTDVQVEMTSGTYPNKNIAKSKKSIVHDAFVGVFIIIMASFILVSILAKNGSFALIAATAISFLWLTVFRNIFLQRETSTILTTIFVYTILFFNAIILHYYCNGSHAVLQVSICIVSPILLAVMNGVFLLTMFITKKWYKYSFHNVMIGLVEILWLVICIAAKIKYAASIVCASIGLFTIVFLLVAKRNVVFSEFKKRFHL